MNLSISVNTLTEEYCPKITAAFTAQGWRKPENIYMRYLLEIMQEKRAFVLAEKMGEFAGYVTVVWGSEYPPFREAGIPEIVDFNVLKKFQRQGIGSALLDKAEWLIGQRSKVAGIGVGLFADYGAAQRLYVKRGFVPDGQGIFQNGRHLSYGDQASIDDDLVLYFTKSLS